MWAALQKGKKDTSTESTSHKQSHGRLWSTNVRYFVIYMRTFSDIRLSWIVNKNWAKCIFNVKGFVFFLWRTDVVGLHFYLKRWWRENDIQNSHKVDVKRSTDRTDQSEDVQTIRPPSLGWSHSYKKVVGLHAGTRRLCSSNAAFEQDRILHLKIITASALDPFLSAAGIWQDILENITITRYERSGEVDSHVCASLAVQLVLENQPRWV